MTDAAVPHDFEAERSVLGSVLIRQSVSDVLGVLKTDDFFLPAHREIWDAALNLAAARTPVDMVTVASDLRSSGNLGKLDGQESYLLALHNATPTAENILHYAGIVRQKALSRQIIAACLEAASRAATESPTDVLAELRVALADMGTTPGGGPMAMAKAIPLYLDVLEARAATPSAFKVKTNLRALDEVIGGHRPGQQIVVAGMTGAGKTSHAVSTAIRAAQTDGVPVLIFSLEMSRDELIDRALSFVAEVDGSKIANGDFNHDDWKRTLIPKAKEIAALPISIDDRKLNLDQIVAESIRWRAKNPGPLALVVVDYLGLIRSTGQYDNRQMEMGAMSRALKILAGDLKCPVIVVAQLNRANQSGDKPTRPVLSNLRDSGEIEQNADVVIFTWRDGPIAELIVAKHRGGPLGIATVKWDGRYTAFYDDIGPGFDDEERWAP